ncbi:MAG: zinc-dependent alcohol dehydrogenase [Pseudomonadales bacterium]
METMKAAVLHDVRDLRVVDVPKPAVTPDGVLIRVRAVGVCGTDLHTYKKGMFTEMSLPQEQGVLFGHEFAGDIAAIGPQAQVEGFAVGDRVTGVALGAYAEYCNVGAVFGSRPLLLKLPAAVSYEEAATVEPLVVSLTAVRRANPQAGERVLVIGAGMIGLGCVQVLQALHPDCEVIVCDVSDKRLAMATEFGAGRTINALREDLVATVKSLFGDAPVIYNATTSGRVDVVLECAGLALTLNQALELARPATGRVVGVALYEDKPEVDFNQVVTKNLQVIGTLGYTADDVAQALALIADRKVDRKPLITHRYPLGDAAQAFEAQIDTAETLKAVIIP